MSVSPENQQDKSGIQLEVYRGKFPEIPEQELQKIVQKYASDHESCQKMLEIESKKCLYGSSPTAEPTSPLKLLTGGRNKTDGGLPFDLPRSNSTGSAGSSHSSGRSTPVNPIPTPWVVPRYPSPTTAGHGTMPMHYPTSALPPGTLYINGNYYQPVASASHVQYPLPGHQPTAAGQVSPNDKPLGSSLSAANQTNPTSQNAIYPACSTNGYVPLNSARTAPKNPTSLAVSSQTPGVSIPTQFFSPTSQADGYQYYTLSENSPYHVAGQFDLRYHTLPSNNREFVLSEATTTPSHSTSTSTSFRPVTLTSCTNQRVTDPATLKPDEQRVSNISACWKPSPVGGFTLEPLYIATGGFSQNSPEISRWSKSSGSPEELQQTLRSLGLSNRQPVAEDDYLRACLSRQQKRFQKLQKEWNVEKERLEIVIKEISERDNALYLMKNVVEPNPTDEQIQILTEENETLNRTIKEISKNIDRLDNGQAFLPPVDPRIHDTQRLPSGSKHRETFDRSNSVPCLQRDPVAQVHPPQLSRPLSELDMNHTLNFDRDRVHYQVKQPSDATLQEWNFINPSLPNPIPPSNINSTDDETQWSCSRCTFLNHNSLTVCEMCGSSRHQ